MDLFGRERELSELTVALDDACAGATRLVLIAGEPGIGKTTLAGALSDLARERGARAIWGRAVETGGAPAFWPWVQVVRGTLGPDGIAALRAESSPVAALLPESRESTAPIESEAARFELFDAFARLLANAARWAPLVIVLDDLHAADLGSLRLLHFCSREIRDVPVLLCGTYRDVEVRLQPDVAEVVGRISREGRTVALKGLHSGDVAGFLRSALGSDEVAGHIHELTGGNPLFLHEVVRLLQTQGTIEGRALPEGVRETILQRLRPLPMDVRDSLDVAAVCGVDFSVPTLALANRCRTEEAISALDRAAEFGLVRRETESIGRYRFSHALVREALYEQLTSDRRAELHERICDAVLRLHGDHLDAHLAEVAHHSYEAARAGRDTNAVEYSKRAGEQALRMLAYEEAVAQFERALQLLDEFGPADDTLRCELLLALSEARWKAGEQERAREAFADAASLARRIGEPVLLARAALGFGAGGYTGLVDTTLVELLEEALDSLEGHDALRARLLSRLSLELYYEDVPRARSLTAEALELASGIDDPATVGYVLNARRNSIWGPDDLDERIAAATAVAELGERHNLREFAMEGHAWRLLALAETGDARAMDREVEALTRIATELRQPFYLWELDLNLAARALSLGRLEEAEQYATRAAQRGEEARIADAPFAFGVQLFFIRDLQGRLHELENALDDFLASFPAITALQAGIAYTRAELGQIDEARRRLHTLSAGSFASLPRDRHWLLGVGLCAAACWRAGDADTARVLYDVISPYRDRVIATTAIFSFGTATYHLGLLAATQGNLGLAISHLEDSLERSIAMHNRPWAARTSFALASVLIERDDLGDAERARSLLRNALDTAGELGMSGLVQDARAAYARVAEDSLAGAQFSAADDGTVAILFTDIVSSTELIERLGDERAHEVMRDHHRIVRKQIAEFGGDEMRFQGDGFMVTFPDARSAVACAVWIQSRVAAYSRGHADTPLHVRAGIHCGVPIIEDGELHGRAVVIASRIADAAGPGEILVSSRVRGLVGADVLFAPSRTATLKGLDGMHELTPVLWG